MALHIIVGGTDRIRRMRGEFHFAQLALFIIDIHRFRFISFIGHLGLAAFLVIAVNHARIVGIGTQNSMSSAAQAAQLALVANAASGDTRSQISPNSQLAGNSGRPDAK